MDSENPKGLVVLDFDFFVGILIHFDLQHSAAFAQYRNEVKAISNLQTSIQNKVILFDIYIWLFYERF